MNKIMTLCASFVLSCIMGVSVFAQGGYEVKGVVVDAIGSMHITRMAMIDPRKR